MTSIKKYLDKKKNITYTYNEKGDKIMSKFFSRKFLVAIATLIIDILAGTGVINKDLVGNELPLINGISAIYISVEGLIDAVKKKE